MKLLMSAGLILVLGLTWTKPGLSSDPGPTEVPGSEDCKALSPPLSLSDSTPILGRFHYMAGHSDSNFYKILLSLTSSFWFNITQTSSGLHMRQFYKMNGTCAESRMNSSIDGNTSKVVMYNMSSEVQISKLSENSRIISANTRGSNIHRFLQALHMDPTGIEDDLNAHSMYLTSRDPAVSEEDLQLFRRHARCAGFTKEPDFKYDHKTAFCTEEESVLMLF